ncbi:DMT family transporter, partial [Enterobacter hormaechei]
VLSPGQHSFALDPVAFGSVMLGLFGVTIGALYQRRAQGDGHIFANTFLQYVTLTISMGAISLMFESAPTQWSLSFALGLGWLVIGVSVLAIMLLIFMIRSGEATKVATYFYLVPILTAAEAWLLFGEAITLPMLVGMAVTIIGLIFVIRE